MSSTLHRRAVLALAACVLPLGLAAQSKPALPSIKLALIESLSGPFANTGRSEEHTSELQSH